jgi:hypothetical protein
MISSNNTVLCVQNCIGIEQFADSSTVQELRKLQSLKITEGYKPKNIYNANETGLFFRLLPNKTPSLKWGHCIGVKNYKEMMILLLTCNANRTDELPPSVGRKNENPHCFKNVRKFPTKYVTNRSMGYMNHLH